ncbi:hypothetical protein ACFWVM_08845 [Nocardia fluminea]|uniref:hypothetical protein n=1 Tax=Nocardia fluminea TaxID=134984 RepID=UPI003658FFCB
MTAADGHCVIPSQRPESAGVNGVCLRKLVCLGNELSTPQCFGYRFEPPLRLARQSAGAPTQPAQTQVLEVTDEVAVVYHGRRSGLGIAVLGRFAERLSWSRNLHVVSSYFPARHVTDETKCPSFDSTRIPLSDNIKQPAG